MLFENIFCQNLFMENINRIYVKHATSEKGNDYAMLVIEFKSGYVFQQFLNSEKCFAVEMSLSRHD